MFATTDLLVGVDVHRRTNVVQVMDGHGSGFDRPDCGWPTIAPAQPPCQLSWQQTGRKQGALTTFTLPPKPPAITGCLSSANWNKSPDLADWSAVALSFQSQSHPQLSQIAGRLEQNR